MSVALLTQLNERRETVRRAGDPVPSRLASLDAYRGLVMLLLMAEVLSFESVASRLPGSTFWAVLAFNQAHVPWIGCSVHDLIQPSFSFLVGVVLPYSMASRATRGQAVWLMTAHALWRSLLLVLLGVFLRSVGEVDTNWTFEDTLTQIGLGYPFLFLLALRSARFQAVALGIILLGYWLAWALYPLTDSTSAFADHWSKSNNLGTAFDQWFLNLFPRSEPFVANSGGYVTLNFIPTLGTMILGLLAGNWLKSDLPSRQKIIRFLLSGIACIAAGLILHVADLNPIVKRIWTPAWTLFSGGLCLFLLSAFYALLDVYRHRRWAFPLIVIGMNSITAYVIAELLEQPIAKFIETHIDPDAFKILGAIYEPLLIGIVILTTMWLILLWMYRRRLFVSI